MKKIISLALAMILVLGLCACTKGGDNNQQAANQQPAAVEFKAGYGRVDITPADLGSPMAATARPTSVCTKMCWILCMSLLWPSPVPTARPSF